jgi:hypothetical protein
MRINEIINEGIWSKMLRARRDNIIGHDGSIYKKIDQRRQKALNAERKARDKHRDEAKKAGRTPTSEFYGEFDMVYEYDPAPFTAAELRKIAAANRYDPAPLTAAEKALGKVVGTGVGIYALNKFLTPAEEAAEAKVTKTKSWRPRGTSNTGDFGTPLKPYTEFDTDAFGNYPGKDEPLNFDDIGMEEP